MDSACDAKMTRIFCKHCGVYRDQNEFGTRYAGKRDRLCVGCRTDVNKNQKKAFNETILLTKCRDYKAYLQTKEWDWTKRRYAESELPKKCLVCLIEKYQLHHLNYERFGAEWLSDLVPLCSQCHLELHKEDRFGRYDMNAIKRLAYRIYPGIPAIVWFQRIKPFKMQKKLDEAKYVV